MKIIEYFTARFLLITGYIKLLVRNVFLRAIIDLVLVGIIVSVFYCVGIIFSHLASQNSATIVVYIKKAAVLLGLIYLFSTVVLVMIRSYNYIKYTLIAQQSQKKLKTESPKTNNS
jgi:hypothetical protein